METLNTFITEIETLVHKGKRHCYARVASALFDELRRNGRCTLQVTGGDYLPQSGDMLLLIAPEGRPECRCLVEGTEQGKIVVRLR